MSYNEKKRIDIFKQTDSTFSVFKELGLKESKPIMGLKFIETKNNIYLFYLDQSYAIDMITLTNENPPTETTKQEQEKPAE